MSKIAAVIGPSGKVIKDIIAKTSCKIDINDDGRVNVASSDSEAVKKAIGMIEGLVAEAEVGKIYKGTVRKIVEFGAFINILPNQDGLLHISEIAHERVRQVEDYLKEGDVLEVKVIEVDPSGKVEGAGSSGGGSSRDNRGGGFRGPSGPRHQNSRPRN